MHLCRAIALIRPHLHKSTVAVYGTNSPKRCFSLQTQEVKRPADRLYFYWISEHGRLYCIESDTIKMPSGPNFLRDIKTLNFFFSRIKKNDTEYLPSEYPWLSICGKEYNLIKCADTPVVFHGLRLNPTAHDDELIYGGDLSEPFRPDLIYVDARTGRFYHPLTNAHPSPVGLISSHVAMQLGESLHQTTIQVDQKEEQQAPEQPVVTINWRGKVHQIRVDQHRP